MAAIAITGQLTAQTSPAAIAATKTSSNNEKITDAGACVVKITSSATGCDIVVDHSIVSPRDHASGQASGKRMHKPFACLVDWDGTIKGGFSSETVAQAEGQRLPDNANGRCAIKVVVDAQPGTIEIQSWSWGMSQAGKHTKTGHVTLMK